MKIEGRKNVGIGSAGPVVLPGQAPAQKTETTNGVAGDSIEISSASREVGALHEALGAIPDVRTEMVEGIRGQVEDGSYHVESEKIAKRVVDEALEEAVRRHRRSKGQAAE